MLCEEVVMNKRYELIHEDFPQQFVVARIEAPSPALAMALVEAEGLTFGFEPGTYWLVESER